MRVAAVAVGLALALALSATSARADDVTPPPAPLPPNAQPAHYLMPAWVLLPPTLAYDEGDPIPFGYTLKRRAHRPLLVGGAITFGVPWVISALAGVTIAGGESADGKNFLPLVAPVVGPFITVGTARTNDVGQFWLTLDGLTQTAGAAMIVAGLLVEQKYLQRGPTVTSLDLMPEIALGAGTTRLTWRF